MYEKQIMIMQFCTANVVYRKVTVSCVRAITNVQVEVIEIPTLANNALGKHALVCIVQTATKYSTIAFVKRNMLPDAGYRLLQ